MSKRFRDTVRVRAGDRCEYCHLPQWAMPFAFHVEHILPRQHGGTDDESNLALACDRCNLFKGPNLTAIDVQTQALVRLFNPREQAWSEHFKPDGPRIESLTPVGRATVELLQMNAARRVALREALSVDLR